MANSCTARNLNRNAEHTGKHDEVLQLNNRRMPDIPSVHRAGVQRTSMHLGYGHLLLMAHALPCPQLMRPPGAYMDPTKTRRVTPLTHSQTLGDPEVLKPQTCRHQNKPIPVGTK